MVTSSPTKTNTVLSRIFYEKTRLRPDMAFERAILESDRCLLSKHPKVFQLFDSPVFIVGEKKGSNMLAAATRVLFEGNLKKVWSKERDIYQYNLVFYYNGDKPRIGEECVCNDLESTKLGSRFDRISFLFDRVKRDTEHGVFTRTNQCVDEVARSALRQAKVTVIEDVDEYVKEFSGFSDLVLDNFRSIFRHYAALCSFIFSTFSVHWLVNLVKPIDLTKLFCWRSNRL